MTLRMLILGLCMVMSFPAFAGIQAALDGQILDAAKAKSRLSDQDILFDRRCEMIEKYLGYDDTAMSRAMHYSCQGMQIGIAFFVGPDLDDYPPERIRQAYIERFDALGLPAEVFIDDQYQHGTNMVFFIKGECFLPERIDPVDALDQLTTISSNAKMMFIEAGWTKKVSLSDEEREALSNWIQAQGGQRLPPRPE